MTVLNPLEADRPHLATTLLPGLLEALARNVSRGAVDAHCSPSPRWCLPTPQTRAVDRASPSTAGPPMRRSRRSTHSLPRQPQHVGVVLTGLREPAARGGRAGRSRPPDAFEAVRVIGRAAGSS